jgi:hypothetical protein
MGTEDYYRVLGQAVDDGKFADEIKRARDNAQLKEIVRMRTGKELNDVDLDDVKAAVGVLPEFDRPRPGRKIRY